MTSPEAGVVLAPYLSGDPPSAFVVAGEGAGLAEMLVEGWRDRFLREGETVELSHLTPLDLERESVTFTWRTPSFFVSNRLYLLPDLADLKKGPREEISAYLKEPAHRVVLFIPATKKDAISTIRGVKTVSLRTDQIESAMAAYAVAEAERAGGSISPKAATFLARWIGADFRRFKEEVAKLLATVASGKTIGEGEIRAVCIAGGFELDPFAFADALIARNREQAVTMFRKFSKSAEKDEYFKLLGAVSWKVRASGSRLSPEWGAALIDTLAAIDRGIKGESELSPDQFVEISLLKLLG